MATFTEGAAAQSRASKDSVGQNSILAYERAQRVFPGGVTRVTIQKDPYPVYVERGEGAYIYDVDGHRYLDLANNFTTLIHGHAFAPVVAAIQKQAEFGTCFGNPTLRELDLAELLVERIPSVDQIRFVNTGTEAVMHAIKAARSVTGRTKIAKIEGAYHGAYDWAEVSESSTPQNWGESDPMSIGVCRATPQSVLDEVVVVPFNRPDEARRLLMENANELAAVLIDPMPSRAGLLPATPQFLDVIREETKRIGALVISDEVLNFRLSHEGAAARLGLSPDFVTLGKIIGGGLPIGAIGGKAEVMRVFMRAEGVVATPQGGTFSANPMSMAAGYASMSNLNHPEFDRLENMGECVRSELRKLFKSHDSEFSVTGLGSLFRVHPRATEPTTYREAYKSPASVERLLKLSRSVTRAGVALATGGLGALSTPMGDKEVNLILDAFRRAVVQS